METEKTNKNCRGIRNRLLNAVSKRISLNTDWVQNHVSGCPKCQRRLASIGRVNLALSILKSRPHNLDLLMRANAQAIGVLKHSLRNEPKAQKLKKALPQPKLFEKCAKYKSSIANAAACIAILVLMKVGIFASMDTFQSEGQRAVKQYYANHIGQDLADDVFSV